MDPARWERIQGLFHSAMDLCEPERSAFLLQSCGEDRELRDAVEAMIEEDARSTTLLDRDVGHIARDVLHAPLRQFGPYRIQKLLGEGGMGVVYLAERSDLGNQVAIKVLRDAWLSPNRRERFATEQRTLAQLNHPGIARLYDADTLPDGTPWFAMEYVDGVPLSDFVARNGCSIAERLKLLRAVCEAVEYAHHRGVIHRDLKPSNILVRHDGSLRLLDFGIARQMDPSGQPVDQTRTAFRPMTPAYAAPEQLRGEPVSARTDVYALGVILYQLLAGRLPFDVAQKTPTEAAAMITTEEPAKPSGEARRLWPNESWNDLDVMCLTAMARDPLRRYSSAEALIRDIDHYLNDEPLEARPDSPGYALGKFLRRHRRAMAVTSGAAIVLAGGVLFLLRSRAPEASATRTVAVLPFHNTTGDRSLDYLSFALPNEVSTTLGYTRHVAVRSPDQARRYFGADGIARQAGRELHAAYVVSGAFSRVGNQLQLSMEMIDVEDDRLQWRDRFNFPAGSRLAMRSQVTARTMRELVPLLGGVRELGGVALGIRDTATQPRNEQAYDLFLHALALPGDGDSTNQARGMLERAVALDPGYAPAWAALASRLQNLSWYLGGGTPAWQAAFAAINRAVALDPANVSITGFLVQYRAELNQLGLAYREAQDALRRRPDIPRVHGSVGYVLRYAGLLDEADRECDAAQLLDAQDAGMRSCAMNFMLRGDYQRARDFLNLDLGSEWERAMSVDVLLREGKETEAAQAESPAVPQFAAYDIVFAFLNHRPPGEIAARVQALAPVHDPEMNYLTAAHLSWMGQTGPALRMLKQAIDQGYCSHQALDTDPLLGNVRALPQFAQIRAASAACEAKFRAEAGIGAAH